MNKYHLGGISAASILDRRRVNAQGEYPVRIYVHYNKKSKYYTTGKTCSPEVWAKLPSAKAKELVEMREDIQTCFDIIQKHVQKLYASDRFSLDNLDVSLNGSCGITLNQLIEKKMEVLLKRGQIATMQSYSNTLAHVTRYKGPNIAIEEVTTKWLDGFHAYLAFHHSINTIGINMRNIRAMVKSAIRMGHLQETQNPFGIGKYVIRKEEGVKKALSGEQIKKIIGYSSPDPTLMMYRDLWLFIFYCNGINIGDLLNLRFSDIHDGEISFSREKSKRITRTSNRIRVTLTKPMQDIIDRWGNEPHPDNYLFNLVEHSDDPVEMAKRKNWANKKFNNSLRIISAALNLPPITTYTARHSYATVLRRNGANILYISESLGHSDIYATMDYLDTFEKEERRKNAALLTEL